MPGDTVPAWLCSCGVYDSFDDDACGHKAINHVCVCVCDVLIDMNHRRDSEEIVHDSTTNCYIHNHQNILSQLSNVQNEAIHVYIVMLVGNDVTRTYKKKKIDSTWKKD
eukprot:GHVR01150954.1.p1 GENE.GHVR01150954.1~~GHVR01150954.1.p1  ORF type:complete len:109 (-),score=21.22 GHVR01150954.1:568-894(-)